MRRLLHFWNSPATSCFASCMVSPGALFLRSLGRSDPSHCLKEIAAQREVTVGFLELQNIQQFTVASTSDHKWSEVWEITTTTWWWLFLGLARVCCWRGEWQAVDGLKEGSPHVWSVETLLKQDTDLGLWMTCLVLDQYFLFDIFTNLCFTFWKWCFKILGFQVDLKLILYSLLFLWFACALQCSFTMIQLD